MDDITNNGVNVLGDEIALIVNVSNSGPSIIRNGNLTLFLPTSNAATGSLFYLYPYEIRIPSNVSRRKGQEGDRVCVHGFFFFLQDMFRNLLRVSYWCMATLCTTRR